MGYIDNELLAFLHISEYSLVPRKLLKCKNVYSKMKEAKALFIWGKAPHLPDPGLTGEVNFSHCLYEIFHLTCQPLA